ncbi:long-chain fatty acid--CoA ligase [Mechercharimyces sp. CAU 1602]|uniref:AMP-dependent synthetase/ligase n=1 Tax=Mechercharimyces sp. CAU 1602 TaxID=2973933 RepID=UPI00216170E8|nr:long-chain fatty acid--CoA ligase [Mechercharimyces sp. CAU 1602]MCS1349977.1 long-chain fatty acid--CoA ligase [Mechercharimyces sp. CAU 1602]
MRANNLLEALYRSKERFPDKAALMWKEEGEQEYQQLSYLQLWERIRHVANALTHMGVSTGSNVAILSTSHPTWTIADYAIMSLGCASVPIYPTLPAEQVGYILKNADCRMVFVEDEVQLEKVLSSDEEMDHIIVMKNKLVTAKSNRIESFADCLQRGRAHPQFSWEEKALSLPENQLATIIHTSGTTGVPKGVMLSHRNFLANIEGTLWHMTILPEDVQLSYLPLSHVLERMGGQFTSLTVGATLAFAQSIDTIPQNMKEVCPTTMVTVPRLLEKVYARIHEQISTSSSFKQRIFNWALKVGNERFSYIMERPVHERLWCYPIPLSLLWKWFWAERLVFRKIKDRLGGRMRGIVSGGAPLHPDVLRFFWAMGVPVLEGYGLTETSPVLAVTPMHSIRPGTVGNPLHNVEVKLGTDGEIIARGPSIMMGYYKNKEATWRVLQDGWFHTGDIGVWDERGHIKVVDRKKRLLILSTGKNVAPRPIENEITKSPYIAQSHLIGQGRKYVLAIIVPDRENLHSWAKQHHIDSQDRENFFRHATLRAMLEREVYGLTERFADFEKPKKVIVASREWTVEGGELTPTLKVRGKVVEEKYRDQIERAYREDDLNALDAVATAAEEVSE